MSIFTRSRFWPQQTGDWATYVVVVVSVVTALGLHPDMPLGQKLLFLLLTVPYAIFLLRGADFIDCQERRPWAWLYFIALSLMGSLLFYLSWGTAWLLLLPLAAQTVYFYFWRGALLLNLLIFLECMVVVHFLSGEWTSLVQSGVSMIAAQVFVIVFTRVAAKEEATRLEVERLAVELAQANQKLREYAVQVEEVAILQERNRLARDIHDGLGHYLTALNMQIKAAQAVLPVDTKRAGEALAKAQTLAQDALASVRQSVAALREEPALQHPLPDVMANLIRECRETGLVIKLDVQGEPRTLPAPVTVTLYRAAQEALTNIRKHALASRADVTLAYQPECVRLKVADNGVGAHQDAAHQVTGDQTGFGLVGLRERVALLGGKVNVITAPKQGFTLEVEIGMYEQIRGL
jgi:signal transduction histidine kinase